MYQNVPSKATGPLANLRVLDMTRILAGPTCTQLLGDYGADVLKVEKPGLGDDTRAWGPPYAKGVDGKATQESAYYLAANRNKRSISIDITTAEGIDVLHSLVPHCDILVENFKVGGLKKYGLDHETLCSKQPNLIYCSISGFGQTGPNAHLPGYDILAQAFGGIMSLTGEPKGEPMKVGVGVADVVCGLYATSAILAAVHHRQRTGEGQHIDISLVDTQISWLVNAGTNYLLSKQEQPRLGNQHPNIVPYQVFEANDGHLIVAAGNDSQYRRFCNIISREDLALDSRFLTNVKRVKNRLELTRILDSEIKKYKKSQLLKKMEEKKVPGAPINSLSAVFASDQVKAREMKVSMTDLKKENLRVDLIGNPVKFSKTPVDYRKAPPECGQHTEEVLAELLKR